jgi:hypothetical protein
MSTDYGTMTLEKALNLARDLLFGPLPKDNDPTPTVEEAIGIIHEARRTCGFNWLTGEAAEKALRERAGEVTP